MIQTLEEALQRIQELELRNQQLEKELEEYKKRNYAGRKKHDDSWMQSYNAFAIKYEKGMTIMEIVEQSDISRRTAYRYKAYYEEINKGKEGS